MADPYGHLPAGLGDPVRHLAAVTPSDSTDLATTARCLIVSVAGALKVTTQGGDTVTIANVPAGVLPVCVARVWATGTTATGIVAGW